MGKGCIIAVNKWDAVEKDGKTMDQQRKKLMKDFAFMVLRPDNIYLGEGKNKARPSV